MLGIRFGAPVVMVSDSARPRVIQICNVTGVESGKLHTSIGLYPTCVPCDNSGRLALRSIIPGFGFMNVHVWPGQEWLPEAGLEFVEELCDRAYCSGDAAAALLRAHDLWEDPFAVLGWKLPRNGVDHAVGGLRMVLATASSPPVAELLMRDGTTAFALPKPVRTELRRSA